MNYSEEYNFDWDDLKKDILADSKIIKKAIIAIIEIATFLEDSKNENYILEMLFMCEFDKKEEQRYREKAVKDFKIKMNLDDFQENL